MANRINTAFLFLRRIGILILLIAPLYASETINPQARKILEKGLAPANVPYEGVMTVTHWCGPLTRSEEVHVRFNPPSSFRREFLRPDGSVGRVSVSDGSDEEVQLIRGHKTLIGEAAKNTHKQMSDDDEWALLEKNYQLVFMGSEEISGRPAWVLELKPLVQGKLNQELWIDKDTGVILSNKRYRPQGDFVVLSRYTQFRRMPPFDPKIFIVSSRQVAESHDFDPYFLSPDELKNRTGHKPKVPMALPFGFEFESADYFSVDDHVVQHIRYTDGLSVLSVFETSKPVRFGPKDSGMSEDGTLLHMKAHGKNYTVMGDVSNELLRTILVSLK